MKKTSFLLIGMILIISGCYDEDPQREIQNCIKDKIEEIKRQAIWNPPAKIYSYRYKGETVYYIPQRCCDIMSILYDKNCNIICSPDGGISGKGDGQCPDFFTSRTDEKLLWEDNRKQSQLKLTSITKLDYVQIKFCFNQGVEL